MLFAKHRAIWPETPESRYLVFGIFKLRHYPTDMAFDPGTYFVMAVLDTAIHALVPTPRWLSFRLGSPDQVGR